MPTPAPAQKPVKKLVFMGSPSFAVPSLQLLQQHFDILAVYTQPPRDGGRKGLLKTPVHTAALAMGLPVAHPERLRGEALEQVLALPADVFCVVGFGMLLPKALVDARTCLNVHPSALPRWRGATPVQSALRAGDSATEVCIMRLEAGMDTGPVYDRTHVAIARTTTAGELNAIVWQIGAQRLLHVVQNLGTLCPVRQAAEGATHAPKITLDWRTLDWSHPAASVHDQIRSLAPAPGAFFTHQNEQIKVLLSDEMPAGKSAGDSPGTVLHADEKTGLVVICGDGQPLRLASLQRPGRIALSAAETLRGWPLKVGQKLTS